MQPSEYESRVRHVTGDLYLKINGVQNVSDRGCLPAQRPRDRHTRKARSKASHKFAADNSVACENEAIPISRIIASSMKPIPVTMGSSTKDRQKLMSARPKFRVVDGLQAKAGTRANDAMHPQVMSESAFNSSAIRKAAYYADDTSIVLNMDVRAALKLLEEQSFKVNCVVTSPPFYGQRDYEIQKQIGLEEHPSLFISSLAEVFDATSKVLADNGSLWVNIGDTYWSGKGQHRSGEAKQTARRFGIRPQDKKGDGKWCVPKQLLLIPHRLAIELQDRGWLVRNDNVWVKPNPIPDQVRDRCSMSHEYVFHFVKERWYYYDKNSVGRTTASGSVLPPLDTWELPAVRGQASRHKARFSEELVRIPILTTTPLGGVVLDPFAGSGTSMVFARKHGFRSIGIDAKRGYCDLMVEQLSGTSRWTDRRYFTNSERPWVASGTLSYCSGREVPESYRLDRKAQSVGSPSFEP
jgi:site-specific DNA-methyltransferase (cytosine-N4-specific)